jgi:hypothetical protein
MRPAVPPQRDPHRVDERYPRPDLVREEWTDLCGPWAFAYDDQGVGLEQRWQRSSAPFDREIVVPFPPESALSGIGDTSVHPVVWYRRTVTVEEAGTAAQHGDGWCCHWAASTRATVGSTAAGSATTRAATAFSLNVTDACRPAGAFSSSCGEDRSARDAVRVASRPGSRWRGALAPRTTGIGSRCGWSDGGDGGRGG